MTLWLRLKKDSISCNASDEKSKDTKKPFSQSSRIIMRFKAVNVRAAGLVFLFHLDGIPAFFQAEFAFLLLARRGAGGHGEDAAIYAHVADLHLVRDAAEGDDRPVLKFSMSRSRREEALIRNLQQGSK